MIYNQHFILTILDVLIRECCVLLALLTLCILLCRKVLFNSSSNSNTPEIYSAFGALFDRIRSLKTKNYLLSVYYLLHWYLFFKTVKWFLRIQNLYEIWKYILLFNSPPAFLGTKGNMHYVSSLAFAF